jgi:hypothetical protein
MLTGSKPLAVDIRTLVPAAVTPKWWSSLL